jgi:hypothetical protein
MEDRRRKNLDFIQDLVWLWEGGVRQILDEIRRQGEQELARTWWIGSGLAASMPFHAAGRHAAGSVDHVFHVAMSSYTPSVKALAFSRGKAAKAAEATDRS